MVDGTSRAEGEISDAAYRQQAAAREGVTGGPGIGMTAGTASYPTSGGGYALDPEQLARHIERFEQIADRVAQQSATWEAAWQALTPPSSDLPASDHVVRSRASLTTGLTANEAKLSRLRAFIAQMKDAQKAYRGQDDDAAESLRGPAGG